MINYSIIIPHKNSPNQLQSCLLSIPVRDDVQVIVIDDNSSADIVDFCNFPKWGGRNYEYYLTKEGKGAGYARNIGLQHAKGKWLLFIDSDDYVLPTIDELFDNYVNCEADVIFFRPKAVMSDDVTKVSTRANLYNYLIDSYLDTGNENEIRTRFYVPWSKFVRMSLIHKYNINFEEIRYSNDVVFSVKVGCFASAIAVVDNSYYVVTESLHSLTSSFLSKPNELKIRAGACINAQNVVAHTGRTLDEVSLMSYLRDLYKESKKDFFIFFNQTLSFAYNRVYLTRRIFATKKMFPKIVNGIFVLIFSFFYK